LRKILVALSAVLLIAGLTSSCTKKEPPPASKPVRVSATKAFEEYFGSAPTTDKGTCYAFVIYFPSAKAPGKVVPFPFFTFDQASLKRVAVQRLMGGMADVKSYKGEILQAFPPGARLLDLDEKGGVVTVNFTGALLWSKPDETSERAMVQALVLTLRQFGEVKSVRILVDGKESALNGMVQSADEHAVLQPSAPRLLSVTAMKEKGAKDVEEVNAFFDRPVDIKTIRMSGSDGKPFAGDVYLSVFDMAAVLKPKDPTAFRAGMPIRVQWNVVDKKGRAADGDNELMLEVKEH